LKPSIKEGYEGILVIIPVYQLSLLVLLFFDVRILLFAMADEKQEGDKEEKRWDVRCLIFVIV
jgi:hypothetical protein